MVRVLVIHWGRNGGGVRFAYEAAKHLSASAEVEVYVSYSRDAEISSWFSNIGVAQHSVSTFSSPWSFLRAVLTLPLKAIRLSKFCRDNSIDVIFSPMEQIFQSLISPTFRLGGKRYLLGVHDANFHLGEESRLREILRTIDFYFASSFLVFSEEVGDALKTQTPAKLKPILQILHPVASSDGARPRALKSDGPFVLGFFGRILPYKGLHLLLEAGELLRDRGHHVVVRVHGEGNVLGNEYLMELPFVQDFRGWVPEESIEGVVEGFDLLILPYIEASQSGVLAVAAGRGIPVIATPVGGLSEQVLASGGGVVTAEVSSSSIADAVERLIADPGAYARYSATGIASANGAMSWHAASAVIANELVRNANSV